MEYQSKVLIPKFERNNIAKIKMEMKSALLKKADLISKFSNKFSIEFVDSEVKTGDDVEITMGLIVEIL